MNRSSCRKRAKHRQKPQTVLMTAQCDFFIIKPGVKHIFNITACLNKQRRRSRRNGQVLGSTSAGASPAHRDFTGHHTVRLQKMGRWRTDLGRISLIRGPLPHHRALSEDGKTTLLAWSTRPGADGPWGCEEAAGDGVRVRGVGVQAWGGFFGGMPKTVGFGAGGRGLALLPRRAPHLPAPSRARPASASPCFIT